MSNFSRKKRSPPKTKTSVKKRKQSPKPDEFEFDRMKIMNNIMAKDNSVE